MTKVDEKGNCVDKSWRKVCKCDPEFTTSIKVTYHMDYIDPCIKKYKNLEKLDLGINGSIPRLSHLRPLENLKELYVIDNKIRDISNLKYLEKLEKLDLRNNFISDISGLLSPDGKPYNPKLKYLDLTLNKIKKIELNHPLLEYLDLSSNKIEDISLNLPSLTYLDLKRNKISDKIDGLEVSTRLKELNLRDDYKTKSKKYSPDHLEGLNTLKNLEKLDLCSFGGIDSLEIIEELINLKELDVSQNKLKSMKGLSSLKDLKKLVLSHNDIKIVDNISSLKNLEELDLENTDRLSFLKGIRKLKKLDRVIFGIIFGSERRLKKGRKHLLIKNIEKEIHGKRHGNFSSGGFRTWMDEIDAEEMDVSHFIGD